MSFATEKVNWYGLMSHNAPNSRIDGRNNMTVCKNDETVYNLFSNM